MHDWVVTVRAPACIILVSFLLLALMFTQKANISAVYASPDIHQGDLVIAGNDVYVIENQRFDINGSIVVEENATLILMNATLNFTQVENREFNMTFQNPLNGKPHLHVSKSKITSDFPMDINFFNNSTANVSELEVEAELVDVKTNDLSNLFVSDSRIDAIIAYDSSTTIVSDSELREVVSRQSSFIEASGCNISFISMQENSHVFLSNCTVVEDLYASESTTVELSESTLAGVYMTGSCNVTFENRLDINGSIMVSGNATLTMRDAIINLTQEENWEREISFHEGHHTGRNPKLHAENATLTSAYIFAISFFSNSSGKVNQLNGEGLVFLFTYDSSSFSMLNSKVYSIQAWDDSNVEVLNSTTRYMDAHGNSSVSFCSSNADELRSRGFSIVNVSDSEVTWRLEASESSIVNLSDSIIKSIDASQSSVVWLVNSTYSSCLIYDESEVYISWHLDVHVIDSIGQDVLSANVTATCPNATVAGWRLADANGWTRMTLMEKMMNTTGEFPIGNYTVEASYLTYSNSTTINMTGNQMLTLKLEDLIIPEFPRIFLLPLFAIATLLAVWIHKRKRLVMS